MSKNSDMGNPISGNKLNIVYMTDEEVMKYLIEISNERKCN